MESSLSSSDSPPRNPPSDTAARNSRKAVRYGLGAVLTFLALNAFGGGYYGMTGAEGIPMDALTGSPFSDFFVPSLILFVVVGGSLTIAAIAVFAGLLNARFLALTAGAIVFGWLAVQVAIIGYLSWMQPTTAVLAAIIVALGWLLPARGQTADGVSTSPG